MRRALFLDRDGVVNVDIDYAHKIEDIEFIPGIFELVRAAVDLDYLPLIVTNQAGIARGYYTEADFHTLMDWMRGEFAARNAPLAGVYYCPHHPVHGLGDYKQECGCRKPRPGMFLQAQAEHGLDMAGSVMVGNMPSDVQAALAAGVGRRVILGEMVAAATESVRSLREVVAFL
jgi:D-glycero-D-manno-heptose 1,7-bisphosphate phosphatase